MKLNKSKTIISILIVASLFSSCKKNTDQILIGEYGSLTGATATFGQSVHHGIEMATLEANSKGGLLGKQIKVLTEDDRSLSEETKTAVLKLLKQYQVVALIGEVASSRSLAAAPLAQLSKIPMISPASTNPAVTEVGDYIFRACFIDSFQGEGMAKFAMQKLGFKNVAILKDIKNDYSVGLAQFFEKTFKNMGGNVTSIESYSEGDYDFRAQLTSIIAKNPDAIFIPGYYTDVGLIARQARELGFQGTFMGGDGWDSSKTVEIGGKAVEGAYYSTHFSQDDPSPLVQDFISRYKTKYGTEPDAMAVLGYDSANMLYNSIRQAGSTDGIKIRDALAQTKNYEGVTGTISIDRNRNAQKKLVVLQITNGKPTFSESVAP